MNQVKYTNRTDFCDEIILNTRKDDSFHYEVKMKNECKISTVSILKHQNQLNKEIGEYITIDFKNIYDSKNRNAIAEIIKDSFHQVFFKEFRKVLVVGLGNEDVVCDALGPKCCEKILVTRHLYEEKKYEYLEGTKNVSVFTPKVMGKTGIESAEMIGSITRLCKPDLLIVIDALATSSIERINSSIQINNVGISPGSGVYNHRKTISEKNVGCPVISIGVATVMSLYNIIKDIMKKEEWLHCVKDDVDLNLIVTPRNMDDVVEYLSEIIAEGINLFVHPDYKNL